MQLNQSPPDVPMTRKKCHGVAPGAPCPAYDDGTWPEGCDCVQRLNDDRGDNSLAWTLLTLLVAAIGLLLMTYVVLGADNIAPCLSKAEARAKWPKDWLYWHGVNRCWDNVKVYARPDRTHKGNRGVSAEKVDEIQYRSEAERRLRECCWPPEPKFSPWDQRIGK